MDPAKRILVVGATWDYVDEIQRRFPERVLFLTDRKERLASPLAPPPPELEILCDFQDREGVPRLVREHLKSHFMQPGGIVTFDCEALEWTAELARFFDLSFPGPESVALCRDKVSCKKVWQKAGVLCPRAEKVTSPGRANEFLRAVGGPIVLKPLDGTGSSGVFKCTAPREVEMYFPRAIECARRFTPGTNLLAAEEALTGRECSCDFMLENGRVTILRVAQKHSLPEDRFGAILAYLVGPGMPLASENLALGLELAAALKALGLDRALGMADFFWQGGRPSFLEIAPRPGGDCLPWVLRNAGGTDTLKAALDFSEGKSPAIVPADSWQPMAGLMLNAYPECGDLSTHPRRVPHDPRIREIHFSEPDVNAPVAGPDQPARLGHVIFRPHDPAHFGEEALELRRALCSDLELVA